MVTVILNDPEGKQILEFKADSERPLIDIMEELDFDMPFSCRAGACLTCAVLVKEGKDYLDETLGGEKFIDTDADQFLTCIGGAKKEYVEKEEDHKVVLEMIDMYS